MQIGRAQIVVVMLPVVSVTVGVVPSGRLRALLQHDRADEVYGEAQGGDEDGGAIVDRNRGVEAQERLRGDRQRGDSENESVRKRGEVAELARAEGETPVFSM